MSCDPFSINHIKYCDCIENGPQSIRYVSVDNQFNIFDYRSIGTTLAAEPSVLNITEDALDDVVEVSLTESFLEAWSQIDEPEPKAVQER